MQFLHQCSRRWQQENGCGFRTRIGNPTGETVSPVIDDNLLLCEIICRFRQKVLFKFEQFFCERSTDEFMGGDFHFDFSKD